MGKVLHRVSRGLPEEDKPRATRFKGEDAGFLRVGYKALRQRLSPGVPGHRIPSGPLFLPYNCARNPRPCLHAFWASRNAEGSLVFGKYARNGVTPCFRRYYFRGLSPVICAAQQFVTHLGGRRGNPLHSKACEPVVLVFVRECCPVRAARGHTAVAVCEDAAGLRIRPLDATANRQSGAALIASGLADRALSDLQMAARTSPECFDAPSDLGNALASGKAFLVPESSFAAAVPIVPDAGGPANLGSNLAEPGRFPEAKAQFERGGLRSIPTMPVTGNLEQLQSAMRNH